MEDVLQNHDNLLQCDTLKPYLGKTIIEAVCTLDTLKSILHAYVKVRDKPAHPKQKWCIVQNIYVGLKCDVLKNGVTLVDLPAVNDNWARFHKVDEILAEADGIVFAAPADEDPGLGIHVSLIFWLESRLRGVTELVSLPLDNDQIS
jgi:hypothetical protein